MILVAIGLYALSSVALAVLEFGRMGWASRTFLLLQFVALILMVVAWLGLSF